MVHVKWTPSVYSSFGIHYEPEGTWVTGDMVDARDRGYAQNGLWEPSTNLKLTFGNSWRHGSNDQPYAEVWFRTGVKQKDIFVTHLGGTDLVETGASPDSDPAFVIQVAQDWVTNRTDMGGWQASLQMDFGDKQNVNDNVIPASGETVTVTTNSMTLKLNFLNGGTSDSLFQGVAPTFSLTCTDDNWEAGVANNTAVLQFSVDTNGTGGAVQHTITILDGPGTDSAAFSTNAATLYKDNNATAVLLIQHIEDLFQAGEFSSNSWTTALSNSNQTLTVTAPTATTPYNFASITNPNVVASSSTSAVADLDIHIDDSNTNDALKIATRVQSALTSLVSTAVNGVSLSSYTVSAVGGAASNRTVTITAPAKVATTYDFTYVESADSNSALAGGPASGESLTGHNTNVVSGRWPDKFVEKLTATTEISTPKIDSSAGAGNLLLNGSGSGKVGINTTSPQAQLHVAGNADTSLTNHGLLVLGETGATNLSLDANEIQARNNGVASTLYLNADGGPVHIHTFGSTTEKVTVLTDGKVGIGTSSPIAQFHLQAAANPPELPVVGDADTGSAFFTSTTGGYGISFGVPAQGSRPWIQAHTLANGGSALNMSINPSGGRVGIGENTPSTTLDVKGTFRIIPTGSGNEDAGNWAAPASNGATGRKGEIRYDDDYLYIAIDNNTWKKVALTSIT
jgi:hypothetical protein